MPAPPPGRTQSVPSSSEIHPLHAALNSPEKIDHAAAIYGWSAISDQFRKSWHGDAAIHFVRHGESLNNRLGLVTGKSDPPLTDSGRRQAQSLRAMLVSGSVDLVISSTLRRARETMAIALASVPALKTSPYFDPRVNERSLGELENQPNRPVRGYARGDLDFAPEGGESYRTLAQRCFSFLIDLRAEVERSRQTRRLEVFVFSHVGPMRVFKAVYDKSVSSPAQMMAISFENTMMLSCRGSNWHLPDYFIR
ncbi:MAG TPA: histidine phosphatase family protein [Stellaceae bacterium]|nr:histidine phosphatase family protein [Stellaceae bacterium]